MNYSALRMAGGLPGRMKALGVMFGAVGILFMVLVVLCVFTSLLQYFIGGGAYLVVRLLDPLLLGVGFCTTGSLIILVLGARGRHDKKTH
ncbi:hypothetical protein [Xanthomonas indica]|uniref:Holin-X, holin superfamily III n=1 Tax=Xanthomonas indica TaxID=2912242 RepID=A0AAU8I6U9_9XANT|nr:hypothetical protein [Xanthomonas indica]MCI2260605.1 hypothetical protein [Xanthomonas indica]